MDSFFAHLSEQLSNYKNFGSSKLLSVIMETEDIDFVWVHEDWGIKKFTNILDKCPLFHGLEVFKNVSTYDVAVGDEKEMQAVFTSYSCDVLLSDCSFSLAWQKAQPQPPPSNKNVLLDW